MTLRLYNTLTRRKEDFVPLDPANVRMYVCGPTVYDLAHIGNARPVIVFDVLYRLLRHLYGPEHVTYARNITDVDDKIIQRAAEEGVAIDELTTRTTKQFHEDVKALGCLPPTLEPRATQHIPDMIAMIARLIEKGCAYEAEGHVLFDVSSMPDYGRLSGRSVDEMVAGARVEVAPYKRNPMDFVLWKPAKQEARSAGGATGTPGDREPGWESEWSYGRPGWHIECSAMSAALLGETFDIHGGGIDLVFPHHENEIAQSRCAHGTGHMARYWMHNGYLQVEGEKMAKSAGNVFSIRELLDEWPGEVLRLAMLMTHYRQPLNWTRERLTEAYNSLVGWYHDLKVSHLYFSNENIRLYENSEIYAPSKEFIELLSSDLNTHSVISYMHSLSKGSKYESVNELLGCLRFLGLLDYDRIGAWGPIGWEDQGLDEAFEKQIVALVMLRNEARKLRNFAEADRIRDELAQMGIQLKDNPDGTTTWELAR